MESLQLFSELLLTVCAIHLIFSTKEMISGWMDKNQDKDTALAKGKSTPIYFDWYVFFDPADLLGKKSQSTPARQSRNHSRTKRQDSRPQINIRPRARI